MLLRNAKLRGDIILSVRGAQDEKPISCSRRVLVTALFGMSKRTLNSDQSVNLHGE